MCSTRSSYCCEASFDCSLNVTCSSGCEAFQRSISCLTAPVSVVSLQLVRLWVMTSPNTVPDRMLTRIGGLLRQAESTDNEHEAEAFLAAAQRLATRSSVDLAVARAHIAGRERRPTPVQRMIPIG